MLFLIIFILAITGISLSFRNTDQTNNKTKNIENYDGLQDTYLSSVVTTEVYPHGYYIGKYPYYRFHFNYVPYGFY